MEGDRRLGEQRGRQAIKCGIKMLKYLRRKLLEKNMRRQIVNPITSLNAFLPFKKAEDKKKLIFCHDFSLFMAKLDLLG